MPILFIERSLALGQLLVEPIAPTRTIWERESVEPDPRLRASFPPKRHKGLEAVVYLETRRRLDRLPRRQQQSIQLLMHYLAAELESRRPAGQVDLSGSAAPHQADLVRSQACRDSFLSMPRRCIRWGQALPLRERGSFAARRGGTGPPGKLQFDRIAIFLTDRIQDHARYLGTNEAGELIDERHFISPIPDHPTVQEALRRKDYVPSAGGHASLLREAGGGSRLERHGVALGTGPHRLDRRRQPALAAPLKAYQSEIFKQYAAVLSQLLIRQRTQEKLSASIGAGAEGAGAGPGNWPIPTGRWRRPTGASPCCLWKIPDWHRQPPPMGHHHGTGVGQHCRHQGCWRC